VKRCAARRVWSARVQGEGCAALGARCRACACVERAERSCVRAGMRTPVSASQGIIGHVQNGAGAWPIGGLGGSGRLGELDGVEWDLVAQWWSVASPRSFSATGMRPGHAGE
jgi:hypothetical protein